jgi:hypothetical protein
MVHPGNDMKRVYKDLALLRASVGCCPIKRRGIDAWRSTKEDSEARGKDYVACVACVCVLYAYRVSFLVSLFVLPTLCMRVLACVPHTEEQRGGGGRVARLIHGACGLVSFSQQKRGDLVTRHARIRYFPLRRMQPFDASYVLHQVSRPHARIPSFSFS